jgi:hypothetical protein
MLSAAMFDTGREADWSQGDVNYDGVVDLLDLGETLGAGLFDGGSYLG